MTYCNAFWALYTRLWQLLDDHDPRFPLLDEYRIGLRLAQHLTHCKRCKRAHPAVQAKANEIYWEVQK